MSPADAAWLDGTLAGAVPATEQNGASELVGCKQRFFEDGDFLDERIDCFAEGVLLRACMHVGHLGAAKDCFALAFAARGAACAGSRCGSGAVHGLVTSLERRPTACGGSAWCCAWYRNIQIKENDQVKRSSAPGALMHQRTCAPSNCQTAGGLTFVPAQLNLKRVPATEVPQYMAKAQR